LQKILSFYARYKFAQIEIVLPGKKRANESRFSGAGLARNMVKSEGSLEREGINQK